jgi:cytochrome P450
MPIKMNDIPGPAPVKNLYQVYKLFSSFNNNSLGLLESYHRDYGDVVLLEVLGQPQLFIANPELFREIMVTKASSFEKDADYKDKNRGLARFLGDGILVTDGEFWKKQRKLVTPAFHINRISEYAETMVDYSEEMLSDWTSGTKVDVAEEMMKLTLRIVARTLFNTDIRANIGEIDATMQAVNESSGSNSLIPTWVPTPKELKTRKAIRDLDAYVYGLIKERRENFKDEGDLLSMLLLAEDDEGNRMSDKQLRDEAVTLFLAGHETTANTLNWTFYYLAQYPEVEAKLHEELDRVLAGRKPTLADLRQLPYTEKLVKESMRFMPAVSGVGRKAIEDVQIGNYLIEKGTSIILNFYTTHRDSRYWDEPLAFNPERFTAEKEKEQHRYAYIPFGAGARVCVGFNFAIMEANLLLATIAQDYRLVLEKGQEIIPMARITTYPKEGLPMRPEKRERLIVKEETEAVLQEA